MTRSFIPALAVLALSGNAPQEVAVPQHHAAANPAPVPFGPGEEATYQVKFGIISAGEGRLAVAGVEDVRGVPSYRFELSIRGGIPGARVNDQYASWMDVATLASRRYTRDIQEPFYDPPSRTFEIFPEEGRWQRTDNGDQGPTKSGVPLDDISFLYYIRTLPLDVGETYENNRYFKETGNPVVIKVLRKERIEVPAGTFNTIVVQPIVKTEGLFKEGGNAEVYLSDDASRHIVYLRVEIPVLSSITMQLKEFKPGTPLAPPAGVRPAGHAPAPPGIVPRD
jgi:hypothetical protein